MGDFDVDFSDRGILDGHKSLRERAIEAQKREREAEMEARSAKADELLEDSYSMMIEILEIDPRDAECVEFRRLADTSEGKPTLGFTFDKLNFRTRYIQERIDDEYQEIPIIEVRRPPSVWKRVKTLADLGRVIL